MSDPVDPPFAGATRFTPHLPMPMDDADSFLSEPGPALVADLACAEGDTLILGAGGKMGLHTTLMLQRALHRAGRPGRVQAVSRFQSVHGRAEFESRGLEILACDLCDSEALRALPDAPNVIFMAGAKFGTGDRPELLRRMNEELPRQVAARFPDSRFTVFSTGCVYSLASPESGGSTETDPTDPPGEYARSCLAREEAFRQAARQRGTCSCLIRLNYAVEFRYGVLVDIARKVQAGEPMDLSMGYVNVIWQRDAVEQILRCGAAATTEPCVMNIAGPEILPVRELAEAFGRMFGKTPVFTGCEEPTAWLNDASKSHRLFGPPATELKRMMEWTAGWLLAEGRTFGKPTGFENRNGRF
ncbi:MAG: NAD(P)-dependent oxidoreductase [Kiritimatiellia bacterium]|nr:NAD(P)-dependent oxidoreductase [Kiritimatiellia bacterium]